MANPHSIFYELQLQRVLSVIQRCHEPGGITEHQAINEITAIVDPWPVPPASSGVTVTARQIAEANSLPLRFDEQGRGYISSGDLPPEGASWPRDQTLASERVRQWGSLEQENPERMPLYAGRRSLVNTLADPAQWALRPILQAGSTVTRVGTGTMVLEGSPPLCPKTRELCAHWQESCFDAGCKTVREEMRPGPVAYSTDYDTSGFRQLVTTMEEAITRQAPAEEHADGFNGDTPHLIRCIEALLALDTKGALAPHGIGGHARTLLAAAASRLAKKEAGNA